MTAPSTHARRPLRKSVQITGALLLSCLAAPIYAAAPGIRLLATGGTIAGVSDPTGATSYMAGKLSAEQLTAQLPQLAKIARLSTEQVMNVPSQDMRDEDRVLLAQRVLATLDDPAVDGIVITHGTDTLEETAFFLDLLTGGAKPIVITGAARPSDAVSADGPGNIVDAVTVAASPSARGRGVLVVLNESIHTARGVTKVSGAIGGFSSPLEGSAGSVHGAEVRFTHPVPATGRAAQFAMQDDRRPLPDVQIVMGHGGMSGVMIDAAVKAGAKAIVIAGLGAGNMSRAARDSVAAAVHAGVFVVRASRLPAAHVSRKNEIDDDALGTVVSGDLSPQKARLVCQLALRQPQTAKSLQQLIFKVAGEPST